MNSCTVFVASVILVILSVTEQCNAKKSCMQSSMGPSDLYQNGVMNPNYMWYRVGSKIQVPVVLDSKYSHNERNIIFGGLNEIQYNTCIEFYVFNHTEELKGYDYVYITKSKQGCWSHIGRVGRGRQELSLGKGCVNHRTAVHEMIHALGFAHEHVRSDRDNYVYVIWGNISPGRENNFAKRNTKNTDPFGPYDYESIMHYDRRAFSQNGMDTITPIKSDAKIGVYKTMSNWDVKKLLRMYKCGQIVDNTEGEGKGQGHGHPGQLPFPSLTNYVDKNVESNEHGDEPTNENGDYAHSESDSRQQPQPIRFEPNFPNYYHHQTHANFRLTTDTPGHSPFDHAHAPEHHHHAHPLPFPQLSNFYNFFF